MKYQEIEGDLIQLALEGKFDVITHGCNCFCTMGAGIAPQMAKAFDADKFPMESVVYKGDINKLGAIDYNLTHFKKGQRVYYNGVTTEFNVDFSITVVNAYTQYGFGRNHENGTERPLDYEALTLCMKKINHQFKGKHIGLPLIGCGLAGGDWNRVKAIIQQELKDCNVTIVHYKK